MAYQISAYHVAASMAAYHGNISVNRKMAKKYRNQRQWRNNNERK